ncbi:MAG: hypothetical protein IT429_17835 [Gemmataceae bacterium]|nr:hypothetical protein [Gemmataceae bacterium]
MIRLKCPTCTRALGIDPCHAGQLAVCPGCHGTFTVPVPAVLLEEIVSPTLSGAPLDPMTAHASEASSAQPLLPDGPIGLVPDGESPNLIAPAPSVEPGLAGLDLSLDGPALPLPDPWGSEQPRPAQQPAPLPAPAASPPPLPPPAQGPHHITSADLVDMDRSPGSSTSEVPGEDAADWRLLTLDVPDAARDEPPVAPQPLPPPPPLIVADAPPAGLRNAALIPVALAPDAGGPAPYALSPSGQPEPPAPAPPSFLTPPAGKVKRRKTRGRPQTIPGVDDFYLGLGVLGIVWLALVLVVVLVPHLFWLPVVAGVAVWGSSVVRIRVSFQDDDPFRWLKVGLVPVLVITRSVASRRRVGWVAVGGVGLLMVLTGVLAMVLAPPPDPEHPPEAHPLQPFVQPRPEQ